MKEIQMTVRICNTGSVHTEKYVIDDSMNGETYAQDLIDKFNATLRPNESPRILLEVIEASTETPQLLPHKWVKQNNATISRGDSMYDVYKCLVCGVTGKRHGLHNGVMIDSKFKAKKYQHCKP